MLSRFSLLGAFVFTTLMAGACASTQKVYLEGTVTAPAAVAQVAFKVDKHKNTEVDLRVKHLAPPQRLEGGDTTYVVWAAPMGSEEYVRQGALAVTNSRAGKMRFVTSLTRFKLVVTAEKTPAATMPSKDVVLQGVVDATY
jgi:hypothetical protein